MSLPFSLPQKIIAAFLFLILAFAGGFIQGRQMGREAALKAAVAAYQTRERINHETSHLSPHALCLALGGVQHECTDLMRGLDEATHHQ